MNYYLISSESYSNQEELDFEVWSPSGEQLIISASENYSGTYSQSFEDINAYYYFEDLEIANDPYGFGPFPEEMDETIT